MDDDAGECSLQENIKQLQGHILDIQKREVEKMSAYGNSLAPNAEPKKEESEVRHHHNFIFFLFYYFSY